ncbi:MAG: hypothetical protein V7752_01550 [Halopseudomonas sp.]
MYRPVVALFILLFAPSLWATEVSSITACKPEGEVWLCASWKDNRMAVYRSQHYVAGVEFSGEVDAGSVLAPMTGARSGINNTSSVSGEGSYTLQLLACNSAPCLKRMEQLKKIPASQQVEIKNDNQLWQVLLVGRYGSIKTAQQAAGGLMTEYQLRDKPWVRTIDSITRRKVEP